MKKDLWELVAEEDIPTTGGAWLCSENKEDLTECDWSFFNNLFFSELAENDIKNLRRKDN